MSLRCGHRLCRSCLKTYLAHQVESENHAFPTCYFSYCNIVTPNRVLKEMLDDDNFGKALELQNASQARSIDGVPMFCTNASCLVLVGDAAPILFEKADVLLSHVYVATVSIFNLSDRWNRFMVHRDLYPYREVFGTATLWYTPSDVVYFFSVLVYRLWVLVLECPSLWLSVTMTICKQ